MKKSILLLSILATTVFANDDYRKNPLEGRALLDSIITERIELVDGDFNQADHIPNPVSCVERIAFEIIMHAFNRSRDIDINFSRKASSINYLPLMRNNRRFRHGTAEARVEVEVDGNPMTVIFPFRINKVIQENRLSGQRSDVLAYECRTFGDGNTDYPRVQNLRGTTIYADGYADRVSGIFRDEF